MACWTGANGTAAGERDARRIQRANLDGTGQETVLAGLPGPVFIALDLTAPELPGDYNDDGGVDAADYVVWRSGLGTTYTQTDYDVWRAHFGAMAGSGSSSATTFDTHAAVPEPATTLLLIAGATIVTFARILTRRNGVKRASRLIKM